MAKRKKQPIPKPRNQQKVEQDRIWDEVREMGLAAIQMTGIATKFYPYFRNPEIRAQIENLEETDQTLLAMSREVQGLTKQIQEVVPHHQDRNGGSKNEDDMMQAFVVGEKYIRIFDTFDNAVVPLMADLTETLEKIRPAESQELKAAVETSQANISQLKE